MIHEAQIDPMLVVLSCRQQTPFYQWARVGHVAGVLQTGLMIPAVPPDVPIRVRCDGVELWHHANEWARTQADLQREANTLRAFMESALVRVTVGETIHWEFLANRLAVSGGYAGDMNGAPMPTPVSVHPQPGMRLIGGHMGNQKLVAEVIYNAEPWPLLTLAVRLLPSLPPLMMPWPARNRS